MKLSHILIATLVGSSLIVSAQTEPKTKKEKEKEKEKSKTEKPARKKKVKAETETKIMHMIQEEAIPNELDICPACGRG